jgi:hypothetical protein
METLCSNCSGLQLDEAAQWCAPRKSFTVQEFSTFAKAYLSQFGRSTISSTQFKDYFVDFFKAKDAVMSIEWDTWLYAPGSPPALFICASKKGYTTLVLCARSPHCNGTSRDMECCHRLPTLQKIAPFPL